MLIVHLDETEIAWLEPQTVEDDAFLDLATREGWQLERMYHEARARGLFDGPAQVHTSRSDR